MPKAIFVAPPLSGADIPTEGAQVTVTNVRIVKDQWTSIGTLSLGLGLEVEYNGNKYAQLFSLDKTILTGSIGRLLVSIGLSEIDKDTPEEAFKPLLNKKIRVVKKAGKLYWYPT